MKTTHEVSGSVAVTVPLAEDNVTFCDIVHDSMRLASVRKRTWQSDKASNTSC